MRNVILSLISATLITSATSSIAFSKEHHHGVDNANAYAPPYLLPRPASDAFDGTASDSMKCAMSDMYADNDLNVFRDGQCRDDVDAHGS